MFLLFLLLGIKALTCNYNFSPWLIHLPHTGVLQFIQIYTCIYYIFALFCFSDALSRWKSKRQRFKNAWLIPVNINRCLRMMFNFHVPISYLCFPNSNNFYYYHYFYFKRHRGCRNFAKSLQQHLSFVQEVSSTVVGVMGTNKRWSNKTLLQSTYINNEAYCSCLCLWCVWVCACCPQHVAHVVSAIQNCVLI